MILLWSEVIPDPVLSEVIVDRLEGPTLAGRMIPEYMRETEKKSMGDEKSPEQKVKGRLMEERKEEKKEVSKEQDRAREKNHNSFRDRPERRQEKEREEMKEPPRIEKQRRRDGLEY